MQIKKEDTITIVSSEGDSTIEFLGKLQDVYSEMGKGNIIIDLSPRKKLGLEDVRAFLPLSNTRREDGKSFVIVAHSLAIDALPDDLIVVPTLQEAMDIIAMEEIERDLGV